MYRFTRTGLGGFLYTLLLIAGLDAICVAVGETDTMKNSSGTIPFFKTELDPVYLRWVHGPGELRGFWSAHPRVQTKERTGANTFSSHISLHLIEDSKEPGGFRIDSPFAPSQSTIEMGFWALKTMVEIRVLVSTAFEGAAGTADLYWVKEGRERVWVGSREQVNARVDSWVVIKPEEQSQSFPAGAYVLVVKRRKLKVEVWPGPSTDKETWISFPGSGSDSRQQQTALLGTISYSDGTTSNLRQDEQERPWLSLGNHDPGTEAVEAGMFFNVDLGEHNNPFFIYYPVTFQEAFPNAFMRDVDGNPIQIDSNPIREISNPVPAVDDPDLRRLSKHLIQEGVASLRSSPWLRYYVIAGEECYPDYFGTLPVGDFRKAFTDRFNLYSHLRGWGLAFDQEVFRSTPQGGLSRAWYLFREHAMADRTADYMRTFLEKDSEHPVFFPTHGNPFFGPGQSGRKQLGYSPGLTAGVCDGFETGQISIDSDVEFLNLLTLSHTASWGVPVVSPRLGNKTLDPSAKGGGRSFTPVMMRRLFYEAIGHGVWHTGLLQWTGTLGDGEWFIRDTPAEKEAHELFNEIESASPYLMGMSRLQPKVGLYLSDATWLHEGWQARWTGFYQDALSAHWQISLVGDQMLGPELAEKIPVLISLDNSFTDNSAIQGLKGYLKVGGKFFRWGKFAQSDEMGTPIGGDPLSDTPHVVTLQIPPEENQRELLNACTTGSGAHKHVTRYHPAPFESIRQSILSSVSESFFYPVRVETEGKVHAYTLTDGWNLAVVLINHDTVHVSVSLEPLLVPGSGNSDWRWRRIDTIVNNELEVLQGTVKLTLDGSRTALVWMSPDNSPMNLERSLNRCREIIDHWTKVGVDVASLKVCLNMAEQARLAEIDSKAYAFSTKVLQGLGIIAKLVPFENGATRFRVTVMDPNGTPLTGAQVICRIVPGRFHWESLLEVNPGIYETVVTSEILPDVFNPDRGCYEPYAGPVRFIVHARHESYTGDCLVNMTIGENLH